MSELSFSERLDQLHARIADAATRSGRVPEDITLIGVSKRKPVEAMQAAYDAGLRDFGENRAQEVRDKFPAFDPPDITRHFIGHLQSNKIKYLPGRVDIIHGIDSTRIADLVNERYAKLDETIPVLVEVNISGEESKAGVSPLEMLGLAQHCAGLSHLEFSGLMTIGPLTDDRDRIRQAYREMKLLCDQAERIVGVPDGRAMLSMGMTGDFELAIEEGATHIRVGTAIFGPREY